MSEHGYEHMSADTLSGQKRASDPPNLGLQVFVRCLLCIRTLNLGPLQDQEQPVSDGSFLQFLITILCVFGVWGG